MLQHQNAFDLDYHSFEWNFTSLRFSSSKCRVKYPNPNILGRLNACLSTLYCHLHFKLLSQSIRRSRACLKYRRYRNLNKLIRQIQEFQSIDPSLLPAFRGRFRNGNSHNIHYRNNRDNEANLSYSTCLPFHSKQSTLSQVGVAAYHLLQQVDGHLDTKTFQSYRSLQAMSMINQLEAEIFLHLRPHSFNSSLAQLDQEHRVHRHQLIYLQNLQPILLPLPLYFPVHYRVVRCQEQEYLVFSIHFVINLNL